MVSFFGEGIIENCLMLNISVTFFFNVHLEVLKHEKVGSWVKLMEI